MKPGQSAVDPDHPFADLLKKATAFSAAITRAIRSTDNPHAPILLAALTDLARLKMAMRHVVYPGVGTFVPGETEPRAGKKRPVRAKFVGLYPLRDIVKKCGLRTRPLPIGTIHKTFLEFVAAKAEDLLDEEGWE
jgi:hypothetical protein